MSAAEPLYTARLAYPDVLQRERTQSVDCPIYRDGALVVPASGTFTLINPAGTALVDAAAVTVVGSVATYSVTAATLASTVALGEGWLQEWALVLDGLTLTFRRDCAVARRQLYPVVTDLDLLGPYPDLASELGSQISSFQGFIDEAWKDLVDHLYSTGVLAYLVVTPSSLRRLHRHATLELVWAYLWRRTGNDRHQRLWEHHAAKADAAQAGLAAKLDLDHDGRADASQRRGAGGAVVHPSVGPRRRLGRSWRW